MSQKAVEAVLGRLITDVAFRTRFFAEPAAVCVEDRVLLTARERAALLTLDRRALHELAARLDPKIVRAAAPLIGAGGRETGGDSNSERFAVSLPRPTMHSRRR